MLTVEQNPLRPSGWAGDVRGDTWLYRSVQYEPAFLDWRITKRRVGWWTSRPPAYAGGCDVGFLPELLGGMTRPPSNGEPPGSPNVPVYGGPLDRVPPWKPRFPGGGDGGGGGPGPGWDRPGTVTPRPRGPTTGSRLGPTTGTGARGSGFGWTTTGGWIPGPSAPGVSPPAGPGPAGPTTPGAGRRPASPPANFWVWVWLAVQRLVAGTAGSDPWQLGRGDTETVMAPGMSQFTSSGSAVSSVSLGG